MSPHAHVVELSLARRLVRTVLALYLGIALSLTVVQLSLEYYNEKNRLVEEIGLVASTFKPIVMQALWNLDQDQINISLKAMLGTNSDVLMVEVLNPDGGLDFSAVKSEEKKTTNAHLNKLNGIVDRTFFGSKVESSTDKYSFSYKLIFIDEYTGTQNLGDLVITTNSNVVFRRVAPNFYITLISALIKTMILSAIFYLVLNQMVGKPMTVLSRAMRSLDPNRKSQDKVEDIDPELLKSRDEVGVVLQTFLSLRNAIEQRDKSITEYQAHLEEKIVERTKQVEEVFKAKSDFLANMSHEIRTPMNGVLGIAKLLAETDLNQKQERYLQIIENSGETLLKTINAILDHLKIEAGKIELDFKPFCLESIVDNCTGLFTYQARSSSVKLTSVIQSDCPEWVLGDSTRIQQILTNLFSNAFKFTQEGSIDLTVSKVKDVDRNHVLIRFLIKDSGIGIHESKISGLFMPFRQADSSTTRNYGGTGLGLSISKQLTELMGGVVGVKSEEGDGSSFWIDVPFKVESPPVESLKSKEIEKNLLLGKSILLIGDAEIFQSQFVELCAVYNIQSAEVLTGREGLALLEKSMHDNKAIDAIFVSFLNVSNIDLTFLNEISLLTKDHSCPLVLLDFPKSICSSLTTVPCLFIDTPITNGHLLAEILDLFGGSITTDVESPSQQESKYSRIRVLVAEDNAVNQIVILGILDKLGVQSILAENGQQAVDFCSSGTDDVFDLILMDCEMPVMDGWVATKVIRQNDYLGSNCKPVLIYALSAHTKDKFLDEAMDSGMNGYLFKPIVVAQLVEILDNILLKSFR